jgi:hypothetical protein
MTVSEIRAQFPGEWLTAVEHAVDELRQRLEDKQSSEQPADERLSMAEIERRFADEWVLIGEPETDEQLRVLSGCMPFHSADRDELDHEAPRLRPERCAILFMGDMPEDMEVVL